MSDTKRFSFADAYGLNLIAKDPSLDWKSLLQHFSSNEAREIAKAMIEGSGSREAKTAAHELRAKAKKLETFNI